MTTLALALALAAVTPEAETHAKQLFEKASGEYAAGDFPSALLDFTEAYRTDPVAGFLFNIGQCQRSLQHWAEAADYFRRYLAEKPNAKNAEEVRALIAEADSKKASAQGAPASAQAAPSTTQAAPTTAPAATATAQPTPGATAAAPAQPAPALAAPAPAPEPPPALVIPVPTNEVAAAPPARHSSPAPWIVAGLGAAVLLGGGVVGGVALGIAGGNKSTLDQGNFALTDNTLTRGQANTANALATAALPLMIGGGVVALVGVLWGALSHPSAN